VNAWDRGEDAAAVEGGVGCGRRRGSGEGGGGREVRGTCAPTCRRRGLTADASALLLSAINQPRRIARMSLRMADSHPRMIRRLLFFLLTWIVPLVS
jgi:hypothetical protein